ncbi:hypothetical protein H8E88_21560 [candidate division KSB1 bacterium]|nr:hypothetical protein [candidate division KSB1 bacterium]MBL7094522.1 hypothetical protein [candidate division KSB1 bacterium]
MKRKIFFIVFAILTITAVVSWGGQFKKIKESYKINTREELTVYLEIDAGEITVTKNLSGDEISLTGRINEKYDELDVGYDKRHNEFSLTLDRNKWFKSVTDENASRLEIQLPENAKIDFSSKVKPK